MYFVSAMCCNKIGVKSNFDIEDGWFYLATFNVDVFNLYYLNGLYPNGTHTPLAKEKPIYLVSMTTILGLLSKWK